MGCFVQPLEAPFSVAQAAGLGVLPGFGPQAFVGGTHLAGHVAGHLGRQTKLRTDVVIRRSLQPLATARFPVGKGVGTDMVQGSTVRQLGGTQRAELVRGGQQFQFGRQGDLHPSYFTTCRTSIQANETALPPHA